jgi:hypothetical protein
MSQFGRFARKASRRALRLVGTASIAGAKTLIDAVLNSGRASISFEHLNVTDDLDYGRHYVYLLFALTRIRAVGCSVRDARRAWEWLPLRDFIKSVRINWRSPQYGILLSESKRGEHILHINPNYYSSPPAGHRLFAPYFAHPEFYRAGLHNEVREMRRQARNVKIFFAGTLSSVYSDSFRFPILSRDKVLGHIATKFEWAIKSELSRNDSRPILIVSTSHPGNDTNKYKLSLREYLDVTSRSDFFICPPGWLVPHCHNLIEAMSVGTIPITNYHLYMRPPLTPDGNCLAFSTVEELERVINRALCMPEAEIQRLREDVISYYEEHIEPESFGKKLMECSPLISEVVVNDETGR